jgi:hypothetical protein
MEDRMEFLEAKIGDSAEKHAKEIDAVKKNHGDLHKVVAACAKQEHHTSLEKRMAFVEKELGESAEKHDTHKTSMEDRMEFLEAKIGDSAEKHSKEIEACKKNHGDLHKVVQNCAKQDHASSLDKRLGFIENLVGDNADKHAKALAEHKAGFIEHKESIDTRLDYLEALLGDSADKHWKEIDAAKKKLGNIEAAVQKCARVEHHSSLEARVGVLEKDVGIAGNDHTSLKNSAEGRMDALERKAKELMLGLDSKGHKSEIEKLEGVVLAGIDKRLGTLEEKHMKDFSKRMNDYEKKHMQEFEDVRSKFGDVDKALKECANIEHFLGIDRKHGALSQAQAELADLFKGKMLDIHGKVDGHKTMLEKLQSMVDQRMQQFESRLMEAFKGNDFMKELEHRYNYMQEDQKRARDMLESSIQEQIRLEHSSIHSQASQIKEQWDPEVKARQAYQENYRELLGQERSARESQETQIGNRLDNFERSIFSELERVWRELGKEHQPIVVRETVHDRPQQPIVVAQQAPTATYVMPPQRVGPTYGYMAPAVTSLRAPTTISSPMVGGTMAIEMPGMGRKFSTGSLAMPITGINPLTTTYANMSEISYTA